MTSPVGTLFSSVLQQCSAGSEFGSVIDTDLRRRLLRGLFDSYYADKADKPVIFDTNRQWCARLPALQDLFPQAKTIACVRNVAWILDSLERLYVPTRSKIPSFSTTMMSAIPSTAVAKPWPSAIAWWASPGPR
jgi:hypothetical protein